MSGMRAERRIPLGHGYFFASTVALLGVFAFATPAQASQSAKLVYARAAEAVVCGEESVLRQAVARRLGYDPFVAHSENTVVAELRGDGDGLRARIFVIEGGNTVGGAREITSATKRCDELMLAVALAISIAMDPESIDRVVEETPEPQPAPATEDPPPIEISKAPSESPSRPSRAPSVSPAAVPWFFQFALGGFVATGPSPSPSLGIHAAFSAERKHWAIGLEPRWWPSTRSEPQAASGAAAAVSLSSATLAPCWTTRGIYGCYLIELGRLVAKGEVDEPRRNVSTWLAQGIRVAYRLGKADGLSAMAKLDGLYAVTPPVRMTINDDAVYVTPRVSGRFGLEVSYGF
jgi:hypothetical protein